MGIADKDDMKEVVTFPLMAFRLRNRCALRVPDYVMEHEDWFEMNKPAYRVPISHERSFDSWMRYFLINRKQYALRPTQWNGDWEQELHLNMDLHAPHADHWLDIH
jgi:hypothetical protein